MVKTVHIRLSDVRLGSFKASDKSYLIAVISGPATKGYACEFPTKYRSSVNHVWNFAFHDQEHAIFRLHLFKRHIFGNDVPIGSVTLRLAAFEKDTVVSEDFVLHSDKSMMEPATARITVHVNTCDAQPFNARRGMLFEEDAVVQNFRAKRNLIRTPVPFYF